MRLDRRWIVAGAPLLVLALAGLALAADVVGYADRAPDGTLSNLRKVSEGASASDLPSAKGDTRVPLAAWPTSEPPWTYDAGTQAAVPLRTGKADGSQAGTRCDLACRWLADLEAAETAKLAATAARARLVAAKAPDDVLAASQARIDAAEARAAATATKLGGL